MRYAVTVISVAYDLSWVSRSASQGKVSTVTAAQPSTFRACKRRYWAGDPLKTRTRQASPGKLTPLVRVGRRFGIRNASNQDCGRSAHFLRSPRLFAVASATSQPV